MKVTRLLLIFSAACVTVCFADIRVPNNYEVIPGLGAYRFSPDRKTWNDAKKTCEGEGATLAILNSPEEAAAVKRFFGKYSGSGIVAHIGFHDQNEEGEYTTVKGGSLSKAGYNVWKNPSTGSSINERNDCGGMWVCGRLTDMNCNTRAAFICEYPIDIDLILDVEAQ